MQTEFLNYPQRKSNILCGFQDGSSYREYPVFAKHDNPVELVLYSNEFEVVNPLGPHKKKHEIMAFCYILGN